MKVIIAGSRNLFPTKLKISKAIHFLEWEVTEVICGKARGVDTAGEQWAIALDIPVKYFPANWRRYGKAAGMIRNKEMADYADALLVFWDGRSPGTRGMISIMSGCKKPYYVVYDIRR